MGGGPLLVSVCSLVMGVMAAAVGVPAAEVGQRDATSTYIVYAAHAHAPRPSQNQKQNAAHLTRAYTSFLHDTLPAHISEPTPCILYSYAHAMTGFAARLTARQAAHLESQPSVLAVVPDRELKLHTTLSPSFLELTPFSGLVQASMGGTDAVIAVIDTGIYPKDRASFSADPSLPPPPRTFRGGCVSAPDFDATAYCNNKLVGAKFFGRGYEEAKGRPVAEIRADSMSPLDTNGHGTQCASIAAGSAVQNANFLGFAKGTAMGAAPGARIASYKVCWERGCMDSDVTAGVDEAIADNVDVISMSLSFSDRSNLYDEATATATFSAVRKDIFVAAAAGNSGPGMDTVCNLAPWLVTVGASTMNRRFMAPVNLGNGKTFIGASLYNGNYEYGQMMKPLIYGADAGSRTCEVGKLVIPKVAGKIVFCDPGPGDKSQAAQGAAVQEVGAAGAIISGLQRNGEYVEDTAYQLPAVAVTFSDAKEIKAYSKTPNAVASIAFFSTVITNGPHPSYPRIASFSSRGPNRAAPEILKPDVVAPGVSILAAWSGESPPTPPDERRVEFNIMSGTSMATPHVSGVAAMLKVARPSWSPAAIKSALMTTAWSVDSTGDAITDMATGIEAGPFDMGAGHINPNRALDPGLVYDTGTDDYVSFLCALGYTPNQIARFTDEVINCSARVPTTVGNLNYPAFSVVFKAYGESVEQRRVVRNVGSNVNAVYTISGVAPAGVTVTLRPPDATLVFDSQHQTLEYTAVFTAVHAGNYTKHAYGRLELTDGEHKVVSPIAFTWLAPSAIAAMPVAPMYVSPVATV